MTKAELESLARRLAIALAKEVEFAGSDALESSLSVLTEAGKKLNMEKEFEEIDSLSR